MAGFEPDKDIQIIETGLRPGEKLYEELLIKSETLTKTSNKQIFIEKDKPISMSELKAKLDILAKAMETGDNRLMKQALKDTIPTYINGCDVNGGGMK